MTTNHTKAGTGQPLLYQHGQVIQEFGTLLRRPRCTSTWIWSTVAKAKG